MREGMFLKKNVDKWKRFQQEPTNDPDETADRFVTLMDDLAFAKTFYPHSKVTRWINGIAAGVYQDIYRNKKEKYNRLFTFWKFELPFLFKKYHPVLLFSLSIFLLFVSLGVLTGMKDENFIREVLGSNYVEMTEQNIGKGDPFGVYRSDNPFTMFVYIAVNNTFVAFLMALGGLLAGIGTIYFMWQNGLMLGCFQYMFFAKGFGFKSVMVIWIHGTLEILALVISASAGLIIANSMLFPGTYKRITSLRSGIKDAFKVMLSLVPVFITAAFFESYITHLMSNTFDKENNTGIPVWGSSIILVVSLFFVLWYFVIYPIRLHNKQKKLHSIK